MSSYINWAEVREMQDEEGAALGDPRRCPRHPHVKTSSPCGMFDGNCSECEHAISLEEMAHYAQQEAEGEGDAGYDESTNPSNGWRCPEPNDLPF